MRTILALLGMTLSAAVSTQPSTQPAGDGVDSILNFSAPTTAPASAPAALSAATTQPISSPLTQGKSDPDVREGTVTLSDKSVVTGTIATTQGKPLRIWDEQAGEFRDIPMRDVKSIEAQVLWEKDEPQWRFKESGSDIKVETGKTYPARETSYRFTLNDGTTVTGGIVAPLSVTSSDTTTNLILHKRDKGEVGQKLTDLKYVQKIDFN